MENVKLIPKLGTEIARWTGRHPIMDEAAQRLAARITALAPVDTGTYASSIRVRPIAGPEGVTDRLVYSTDDNAGAIEHGFVDASGQFHEGHHTFRKALGSA